MAFPRGAVGWYAVCDVVFPDHIHILTYYFTTRHADCRMIFILHPTPSELPPLVKVKAIYKVDGQFGQIV